MSESDESGPIERAAAMTAVPIFFGKSTSVKRLMQRIKQQGLVVPPPVINTPVRILAVLLIRLRSPAHFDHGN